MKLFLAQADELDGERERLIEFLVRASTRARAAELAWTELKGEWGEGADEKEMELDNELWFHGGEVCISGLRVNPVTERQAVQHFTRRQ